MMARALLSAAVLLLAAGAAPRAHASCTLSLTLPASASASISVAASDGWCAPFARAAHAATPPDVCAGVVVPPGGTLALGTCALPGAACSGATALTLLDDASGAKLAAFGRVALNSTVAKLSQGCVLGVRCSYGEWRSTALTPTAVSVVESCHASVASCAGVVAWRLLATPPALLPALAPSSADALAFTVTASAAQPATLLSLSGAVPAGAAVEVWASPVSAAGVAPTPLAPASGAGWTLRWSGAWPSGAGASVAMSTPLPLPPGAAATLLVRALSGGPGALSCAHALGAAGASTLLSDDALTLSQGGALTSPFTYGVALTAPCAWARLSLSYSLATCAPPPPPPAPAIATSNPATLVASLDDLLRALADPAVALIEVNSHIALNGSQLGVTLGGGGTVPRVVSIEGTNACWRNASDAAAQCSLDAVGASRVFAVGAGVTLRVAHLALLNGAAPPPAGDGGCILAQAGAALRLDGVTLRNCSAFGAGVGGGAAVLDGAFSAADATFDGCAAMLGGGLAVSNGAVALVGCRFTSNAAHGASTVASRLSGLPGPEGGGAALFNASGTLTACSFVDNEAATTDVVLLANPDFGQARGGGLYLSRSNINATACIFSRNVASFGAGLNVNNAHMILSACALVDNTATLGFGGGMMARNAPSVTVTSSLITGNSAGGIGGGVAALNSTVSILSSALRANTAPGGCGGSLGMDVAARLLVGGASVVADSSARDGGGACCNMCEQMRIVDSFFTDNAAAPGGSGGALYASNTPVALRNVSLWRNAAPTGGAISTFACDVTIDGGEMVANRATETHGGALLHDAAGEPVSTLLLTNVRLMNNTAPAAGGAVAALGSSAAAMSGCVLSFNAAVGDAPAGGALFALDVASLALDNCTLANNAVAVAQTFNAGVLGYSAAPVAMGAGSGGAMWIGSNGPTFASVTRSVLRDNVAPRAGGLYATGAAALALRGCAFARSVALGASAEGGALLTDANTSASVNDTTFTSCAAVRGGAGWHGGASRVSYSGCTWTSNTATPGDDTKGSALHVAEHADVAVASALFARNFGAFEIADGTVSLAGTVGARVSLSDVVFDGNEASLGACLYVRAEAQDAQLRLSGVTLRNNYASLSASLMYSEADQPMPPVCAPAPCEYMTNNTAAGSRQLVATPPQIINISMPAQVRSGAPLPITVHLVDGFYQVIGTWRDTVVTIDTAAALAGSLRSFYAHGAAPFPGLSLKGDEGANYSLTFTLSGPELFGSDDDTRRVTRNITVQRCEPEERFDAVMQQCACASGFGLAPDTGACVRCAADEVVPVEGGPCVACPALSAPTSLYECGCQAGYFGSINGARACVRARCAALRADVARALRIASQAPTACARSARWTPTAPRTTRPTRAFPAPPRATPLRRAQPPRSAACAATACTASAPATPASRACPCRAAAGRPWVTRGCWRWRASGGRMPPTTPFLNAAPAAARRSCR
jgi:hypothetical protein